MFDHSNSGRMESGQFGLAVQSLGQNPSESDIADMVKQADTQGTGFITEKDFVSVVTKNWKEVNSEEDIVAAFKVFDREGTGYINAKELTTVLLNLGEHLTEEEVEDMMEAANLDADGQLNYQQLTQVLLAPAK